MSFELVKTQAARRAIAEARDVDEVKDIRDKAEAVRQYAKQAGLGLEMINDAAEIKLRAERRAGEMLAVMEKNDGGRPTKTGNSVLPVLEPTLEEMGVSKMESSRWQRMAELPEADFERHVSETRDAGKELSTASVLRLAAQQDTPDATETPAFPTGKFRCLVIDPPWPVEKIVRVERPLQNQTLDYPIMQIEEIAALPVRDLFDPAGCHVYLWVTHKFMPAGLELFSRWNVQYQCLMTWVKPTGMTPFSWMYNTEHVLFGHAGSLKLEKLGLKLAFDAPVVGHSVKPDIFYDRVLLASPGPRLEMFARRDREGFKVWGNEIETESA